MVEVSTSLLNVNKEECIQKIYDLEYAGTDYFHIDVMDGIFVKNNTCKIMEEYTNYIKQIANTKIDVHLMVKDVEKFVKEYSDMEVNSITFHIESIEKEEKIFEIIEYIKQNNIQVGLSLNPETNIEKLYKFLPYIHKVIIMTVNPGEGGQKLIEETVEKIKELKNYIDVKGYEIDIEADGGINSQNSKIIIDAGVNILVSGNYIIKSDNYKEAINKLR